MLVRRAGSHGSTAGRDACRYDGVEQFPLLGTGKLDLRGVKVMAQKFLTVDGHG